MRVLRFIVDGQIISQDPTCDFSNLVPGSVGYLRAEFSFSQEWKGCVKAASFYSASGRECGAVILKDGKSCVIPAGALTRRVFKIDVTGKREGLKITTNKVMVNQDGGVK